MHLKLTPTEPPRTCALRDTCTSTIVCGAQQVVHDCQGGVQHTSGGIVASHANLKPQSRFFLISYQMSLMRRGWSNLTCIDGQNHPAQTIMMKKIP